LTGKKSNRSKRQSWNERQVGTEQIQEGLLAPQAPRLLNSTQQLLDRGEKQKQQMTELE